MSDNLIRRWCAAQHCDVSRDVDPQGPDAWGPFFCVAHRGRDSRADIGASVRRALPFATVGAWYGALPEHGPAVDAPTFVPTDRQRRRIAGARAWIAQRLTVPYSGELDTGTVHGPELWGPRPVDEQFAELHCDDCGHVETIPAHDDRIPRCENCGRPNVERRRFGTAPTL